ncbi:MAG: hypothetical protein MZV64_19965 [Ignavibacteriales bacterium]|nr:hypothetical protein [Ignavibacteriales bacterium]
MNGVGCGARQRPRRSSATAIYSNTLLGINLGTAGVTANDAGDGDTGANNLQNFPVLTSGHHERDAGHHHRHAELAPRTRYVPHRVLRQHGAGRHRLRRRPALPRLRQRHHRRHRATRRSARRSPRRSLPASSSAPPPTKSNAGFTAFTDTSEFALDITAAPQPGITVTPTSGLTTKESGADGVVHRRAQQCADGECHVHRRFRRRRRSHRFRPERHLHHVQLEFSTDDLRAWCG